jgi:hypothetical protein
MRVAKTDDRRRHKTTADDRRRQKIIKKIFDRNSRAESGKRRGKEKQMLKF